MRSALENTSKLYTNAYARGCQLRPWFLANNSKNSPTDSASHGRPQPTPIAHIASSSHFTQNERHGPIIKPPENWRPTPQKESRKAKGRTADPSYGTVPQKNERWNSRKAQQNAPSPLAMVRATRRAPPLFHLLIARQRTQQCTLQQRPAPLLAAASCVHCSAR